MWPKRVCEENANIIKASKEGDWESVEYVTINGQQLEYVQHPDCEFTIIMCHHCFQIKSTSSTSIDVQLVCKQIGDTQRAKVKFLYEQVPALRTLL